MKSVAVTSVHLQETKHGLDNKCISGELFNNLKMTQMSFTV